MKAISKILFFVFTCAILCSASNVSAVPSVKSDTTIIDTFICKSSLYQFGDEQINETGTYTKTFTTSAGSDSTVVLYLSVEECENHEEESETDDAKEEKSNLNCAKIINPHVSFGAGSDERETIWIIDNIEKYNNVVSIYDRWGKLLYQKKNYNNSDGWDGTFRGAELPSNDYWYAISLDDLGRICYGHFSYKKK